MRTKLASLLFVASGVLMGYLAANTDLNPLNPSETGIVHAGASSDTVQPILEQPSLLQATDLTSVGKFACCQGDLKAELLVAANQQEVTAVSATVQRRTGKKPNILVIMSDDVGITNLSVYSRGLVGYQTPNIDRIANAGVLFTDYYGEQSCTAGRSAFITGQSPLRTGLTKVGLPGSTLGLSEKDPTLAELLKPMGYMTGQFGKNHLGDRNEFLPTVHGFDEFFGNLYHLNAEEEPENEDYPKDPKFHARFGPRGVLDCLATTKDSNVNDPRFGPVGKQNVTDTGPLTRKRMETADEEFLDKTVDFIKRAHKADKPFLAWFNSSRMHFYTHLKPESKGKTGLGIYADGMVEHDGHVGELLDLLDDLKIANNTIVIYTSDNGPHYNEWPDGGISPFRGEKNTNWEGAYRVPGMVRWPARIKAGSVSNEVVSHLDWVPTLMAAAGEADINAKLKNGHQAGNEEYRVHLDGYNLLPYLTGNEKETPRREFFYFSDDGVLVALRYDQWKLVFAEQRSARMDVWRDPFVMLRAPKFFNLRSDPFERADTDSNNYNRWWIERLFLAAPAQQFVGKFLTTFKEFPPRQTPAKFNLDDVMKTLTESSGNN